MNNRHTPLWLSASLLIILAIWLTACGGAPPEEEPAAPEEPMEEPVEESAAPEEPMEEPSEEPAAPEYRFPPPIEGVFECSEGETMVCTIGENDDVIVVIPWQPEHASFLYAISLPLTGDLEDFKNEDRDEFSPHRLIVNLELVIDRNEPEFYINQFTPEIRLGIRYVEADVAVVGGRDNIQMGFWDEENKYWVSFAQHGKYNYEIDGDDSGGYIWVTISNWGDRHIGCDG